MVKALLLFGKNQFHSAVNAGIFDLILCLCNFANYKMRNNLEEIGFDEVIDPGGISYTTFRNTLVPNYKKVALDIGTAYFFLLLIAAILIFIQPYLQDLWWLLAPVGGIAIGYTTAYLALFIHEAGHYNIHPSKKMNDRLASILLCLPFGLSLKSYRKLHWQHHFHLGTPDDAEVSYYNAPTPAFLVETFTGLYLIRLSKQKSSAKALTDNQRREGKQMLVAGILFHLLIISVLVLTRNWLFMTSWILGFGVFYPFFATIRQILEHRDELAKAGTDFYKTAHGKVSRLFTDSWLSRSFGSAGFTRHMLHHWDPQISYTRLGEIEKFLEGCEKTAPFIHASKTTYATVFKKLVGIS